MNLKKHTPKTEFYYEKVIDDVYKMDYKMCTEVYDDMCVTLEKPSQKVYACTILSCAMRNEWGIVGRIIRENMSNAKYVCLWMFCLIMFYVLLGLWFVMFVMFIMFMF